jgi:glycerol uptake operon antiterminator
VKQIFEYSKIICAVKNEAELTAALKTEYNTVFLLKADINSAAKQVKMCHDAGKRVFIHFDLAEGFGKDEASIKYLSNTVRPDGILSTKNSIVKLAKDYGMHAIYRVFMIDSQSMETATSNIAKLSPDAVEIMPGIAFEAIEELSKRVEVQIIAGGFVRTQADVDNAVRAGAVTCSTTSPLLWKH